MLPRTNDVFVFSGSSPFDLQQVATVKMRLAPFANRVNVSYLAALPMSTTQDRLRHLPAESIVLITSFSNDPDGKLFTSREAGPRISQASNSPVFSLFDVFLGHGEVGGDLSSLRDQGLFAGRMARRVLEGAKTADIPREVAGNSFTFDWQALESWGLQNAKLPAGSIVVNRRPTVWESYRWSLLAVIGIIFGEALLISTLLTQRIRRRRTERELAATNAQLRLAMEVGQAVGWDQNIVRGSSRWFGDLQTMFGIVAESMAAKTDDFLKFIHPEDYKQVEEAIAEGREKRRPYVIQFRLIRRDGETRWISSRGQFEYAQGGKAVRMVGMAVDITERRQAEAKLRESEERFRLLANTTPALIWTADTDGQCDYVNTAWLKFTGRELESQLGKGWLECIHPEDVERCFETYRRAVEHREPFKKEYRARRYDGQYRWVLDFGVPRYGTDGLFTGYVGSCVDFTERKLAEEALSNLSGQLITAQEEERSRIAREIHDDYQQRLAVVTNCLVGLLEGIDTPSTKASIRELSNDVGDLVEDLHSLSQNLDSSTLETRGLVAGIMAFYEEL